ncbi:MAG: cytochrome b [Pseudomonadales bacterium]|nr:cytochrome b [Pseudomonadales bacterium]
MKRLDYDLPAIVLHWLVAIGVLALFGLGLWMTDLDYYDPWYNKAPDLHRSIGVCVFVAMVVRLGWRLIRGTPAPVPGHGVLERRISAVVHRGFYLLVPLTAISGYLMSTADGRGVWVFDLIEVPATLTSIDNQEDLAGAIHWYLVLVIVGMAVLHALAALKHHFWDRDRTLTRMLGIRKEEKS